MAADSTVVLRRDPVEKQWVVVPLADPAGDRLFWFNGSTGLPDYLSIGSGLMINGSSLISLGTGTGGTITTPTPAQVGAMQVASLRI